MTTRHTYSSREFNQYVSEAKRAANEGPVFITDRGEPAHVLLSIQEYRRLQGDFVSLADALAQKGTEADFDFDFPSIDLDIKPADLS
ncbi:type II toxin-antitoxin system Phd/YefM family antitoxin [Paraburkholderia phymatum]|uniref:type II toxin-antitoxin system Phd/YefM family antitoxin n=1 Tax=Paraburkholderia phymatum TaxID=148447 RepID=UPI0031819146